VTSIEKTSRRKPGRPRKYGAGRVNATVRFTPDRHAELKRLAEAAGRSVSEQVEWMIEKAFAIDTLMGAMRTNDAALAASVFRREHVPLHTPYGNIWIPKAHPDAPKTGGFPDPAEEKS
jgi:hypothetical protein